MRSRRSRPSAGAPSRCTNSFDEALALPSEHAARIALRTQQVLAHEAGGTDTAGPLGGAYFVEALTADLEERAQELIERVDELGGAVAAIEQGFVQGEIEASAFRYQSAVEAGDTVVVGVNRFTEDEAERVELLQVDPESERRQRARTERVGRSGTRPRRRPPWQRCGASPRRTRTSCPRSARRCGPAARSASSAALCASSGEPMTRSGVAGSRRGSPRSRDAPRPRDPARGLASANRPSAPSADPSFTRDVAPIVREKCTGCHRVGGIAPFPLETARQISSRSTLIAAAVGSRIMPPWPPGPRSPAYVGQAERTLSASQRSTLLAWARAGGRVDGPALGRKPLEPIPPRAGETTLRLQMPTAYRPRGARARRTTTAVPARPEARRGRVRHVREDRAGAEVVHHVILRVDPSQVAAAARRLRLSRPGWSCFGGTGLPAGGSASIRVVEQRELDRRLGARVGLRPRAGGAGVPLPHAAGS